MAKHSRQAVVDLARSWIGKNESDESYKVIVDTYNSFEGKFPRGIKMEYGWAWCACTWSAIAIKLGYTDVMPIEISCYYLIEAAKRMGCWVESDSYIPAPADGILYDWDDDGYGDDTGAPEHVGIIEKVANGKIFVIEGNKNHAVGRREIPIDGRYIRGFITPRYDETEEEEGPEIPEIPTQRVDATQYADKGPDEDIAGKYRVTTSLYCRDGAGKYRKSGKENKVLCVIPKDTIVRCYGYYTDVDGTPWLYIQFILDDVLYTGFASGKYLKKVD